MTVRNRSTTEGANNAAHVATRIVAGPHAGEEYVFEAYGSLIVGRAGDAQWVVGDGFFSRYHFRLEANPPECRLIDLGSANGTKVNGSKVNDVMLKDGDKIECGDTVFAVSIVAGAKQDDTATLEVMPEKQIVPAAISRMPAAFPRRMGEYELTRVLGQGGMGVVYHAREVASGREVAVKVIRPTAFTTAAAMQVFLREASILGQLRHPRIVEYIGMGLDGDQMFLVMEYVPTEDFRKVLATQSRPKQIRLACGIMCRVLEALQYAHEQDVVHRDVKPANMLVYKDLPQSRPQRGGQAHFAPSTAQNEPVPAGPATDSKPGGGLKVKLADFGLAKCYFGAGFSAISRENDVRGTLGYMSPEQLMDARSAKPPSDIYAAGACLYHLLCGQMPFEMTDTASSLALILNSKPRPLRERASDVPEELAAVVERALAREPGERFSSAQHMRQALLRFREK